MELKKEIAGYLDYCEYQKKLSVNTLKAYTIDLEQFQRYSSAGAASEKRLITDYITHLHKTCSPRSAKRKLASIKAFYKHLEFEEIITDNPLQRIKTKFQEPQVLPRVISITDIEKILTAAYSWRELSKTPHAMHAAQRNVAALELLFATGMRVSELCSLTAADVNLSSGRIRIVGKGSKERLHHVGNDEVLESLKAYRDILQGHQRDCEHFFINRLGQRFSEQSVRFMIRRLYRQAGITTHITPHMFRHSFATLLLEADVDIRYIQSMLGHSSIRTTQIYTKVTAEKQRQILESKHPRNGFSFGK